MSAERNFTDQDYEQLSAYLDDALSGLEREALEIRLEADPRLRRELDSLRQTVQLINQIPLLRAPRNFTLDAGVVKTTPSRKLYLFPAAFSALSAAAAIILFMFGGYFLLRDGAFTTPTNANQSIAALPTLETNATPEFGFAPAPGESQENANIPAQTLQPPSMGRVQSSPEPTQVKLYGTDGDDETSQAEVAGEDANDTASTQDQQGGSAAFSEMAPSDSSQQDAEAANDVVETDAFATTEEVLQEIAGITAFDGTPIPTSDADLTIQNAPEAELMEEATEVAQAIDILPAPSPSLRSAPAEVAEAFAPEQNPVVETDNRILGISLIVAGFLCFGLAAIMFIYRRRLRA